MVEFSSAKMGMYGSKKPNFPKNIHSAGLGGNPSSMAHKKSKPNPKVPKTDIFAAKKNVPSTVFKRFYERNDLPVVCSFSGATRSIEWKVNIDMLDYHHYLPVFFEGLRE
jgi:hypothetical protein